MNDAWLQPLDLEACLAHLRSEQLGHLAIVTDTFPVVLPVNYRMVETVGVTWLALRTRPGNVIDQASTNVALEVDNIDGARHGGWTVLVRGTLQRVNPDAAGFRDLFDSEPWLLTDRDSWLIIEPASITGRELHPSEPEWVFHAGAYL